jgi:hypothetical protein
LNFTEKKKEKKEQNQESWQNHHHHHHHLLLLLLLGGGNRFLLSLYLWLMQEVQTEDWFTFSQNPHTHPLLAIIKPKHPQTKKTKKIKIPSHIHNLLLPTNSTTTTIIFFFFTIITPSWQIYL